ncbi:calcium-binding protein [Tabrizicola sp.]|uniref:calcium-binding protein n=1 Tax=Tabrizicola sp. TaxID=2005166 RepID=UPI001A37F413|nr:calcium-binding protein [Tabrizicola sp.]MBL9074804.1 calcium-binding protein [Tabrizicola sp.]
MAILNLGGFSLNPGYIGEIAKDALFGANFLFNRDGTSSPGEIDPNYVKFIEEANVSTLRYPGGTLAEERIDLADPESLSANYMNPDYKVGDPTVPLSSFLALCEASNSSATIVLPTYRFLKDAPDSSGHRAIDITEEANLRSYIKSALAAGTELGVSIAGFEIGNEWYVDNTEIFGFRMSPIEYGRVANYIAAIVQSEIDHYLMSGNYDQTEEPAIIIQVGPGGDKEWYKPSGFAPDENYIGKLVSATELIATQFSDINARKAVDGILMHRYLHGSDSMTGEWVYNPFVTWSSITAKMPGFAIVDRYVTEWNVSARNQAERGLAQFDSMVELFREMLLVGVDHANVWAVQQNNGTRMIANSGSGTAPFGGLTFGGLAFDICSTQLRGLKVIRAPEEISGISVNAFGGQGREVIFLTNRSDENRTHTVDLRKIVPGGHHATIYYIGVGEDGKPEVFVETVRIGAKTPYKVLPFGSQESVVIVIARPGVGVTIEGYDLNDRLDGSLFSDTILGGSGNDTCSGGNGSDLLNGEDGNDILICGSGDDTILGGDGSDYLDAGSGNDRIVFSSGQDTIFGGLGTDIISFEQQSGSVVLDLASPDVVRSLLGGSTLNSVEGYSGSTFDDTLYGAQFDDLLFGDSGNDKLFGNAGADQLRGESGEDLIYGGDGLDSLFGGNDRDTVFGDAGNDLIYGGGGNDLLNGGNGSDSVFGEDGDDFIFGEDGDDRLEGGAGRDKLYGGSGSDTLSGGVGDDDLSGGDGNDSLTGDDGNDLIFGEGGSDRLFGSSGMDNVYGGEGNDLVYGGEGNDLLMGDSGDDCIYGDGGNDHIVGGGGNDRLFGGVGNDFIVGGSGSDVLSGGAGEDTFVFHEQFSKARVCDFRDNVDTLQFYDVFFTEGMSVREFVDTFSYISGKNVIFDFGDLGELTVCGVKSLQNLYDDVVLYF